MADSFHYSGFVSGVGDQALVCLFNNETADARRKFTVLRCNVRPHVPTIALPGTYTLRRITALSNGDTVETVKADTASADLPSQVLVRADCDVTNGTEVFSSQLAIPISTVGLSLRAAGWKPSGASDTARFFNSGYGDSAIQRLTLAAGQGVAITAQSGTSPTSNAGWLVSGALRVQSTGATHYFETTVSSSPQGMAEFAVLNGSGSGVTLELVGLTFLELGPPTITTVTIDAPLVRFARVTGFDGGEVQTAFTPDTATSTPSAMQLYANRTENPLVPYLWTNKAGNYSADDFGYPQTNVALWRKQGIFGRALVNMNSVMGPGQTGAWMSEFRQAPLTGRGNVQHGYHFIGDANVAGLVINPQEGIALVCDNFSAYNTFYVELDWTHTPPPSSGGGGNTYSRSRVVNP